MNIIIKKLSVLAIAVLCVESGIAQFKTSVRLQTQFAINQPAFRNIAASSTSASFGTIKNKTIIGLFITQGKEVKKDVYAILEAGYSLISKEYTIANNTKKVSTKGYSLNGIVEKRFLKSFLGLQAGLGVSYLPNKNEEIVSGAKLNTDKSKIMPTAIVGANIIISNIQIMARFNYDILKTNQTYGTAGNYTLNGNYSYFTLGFGFANGQAK
jgi:hypothetical protein